MIKMKCAYFNRGNNWGGFVQGELYKTQILCLFLHLQMNNMMWQLHMQQLEQLNGGFSKPLQRQPPAGGNSGRGGSRQHNTSQRHHSSQMNSGRNQRYGEEPGSVRHPQHGHSRDTYHHQNDRSSNRHHDNRGGNRHHDNRGYQENRWRRYWYAKDFCKDFSSSQICGQLTEEDH